MKKWSVALPVSGIAHVEVEAENEKAAIEAALHAELTADNLVEWETHRRIVQGNVCYAIKWEADAEEIDE